MNPTIRNILAVISGVIIGSAVNMGIVSISGSVIPPPDGVDTSNMESLKASMHLFRAEHFIMPFLAHALGTLVGAFVAATIAVTYRMRFALVIGVFFLAGGIASSFMLPAPVWFISLDVVMAYIPMALLGGKFALRK